MLVDINTKLAAQDAKVEYLLPQSPNPQDMEDTSAQTQSRLTISTTENLHTADCTVLKVTWSHEVMFTHEGRPAVY